MSDHDTLTCSDYHAEYASDAQPVTRCPECGELYADHSFCIGCSRAMCSQFSLRMELDESKCWRCLEDGKQTAAVLLREASRVVADLRQAASQNGLSVAAQSADTFLSRLRDAGIDHQRLISESLEDALQARMKAAPSPAIGGAASFQGGAK